RELRRHWNGAISDDSQMTRAFSRAEIPIFSPQQSLLLSPVSMSLREAFAFGKRQYRILWFEARTLWILAALFTIFPIVAAVTALSLVVRGNFYALAAIVAVALLGDIRYKSRRKIAEALWGEEAIVKNEFYWRVQGRAQAPLVEFSCALHLFGPWFAPHPLGWRRLLDPRASKRRGVEAAGRRDGHAIALNAKVWIARRNGPGNRPAGAIPVV